MLKSAVDTADLLGREKKEQKSTMIAQMEEEVAKMKVGLVIICSMLFKTVSFTAIDLQNRMKETSLAPN